MSTTPSAIDPELLKKLLDPDSLAALRDPARHSDLALAEAIDKTRPTGLSHIIPEAGTPPIVGKPGGEEAPSSLSSKTLPVLSTRQQRRLPNISPGVAPGSSADLENQLTQLRTPREPIAPIRGEGGSGVHGVLQHIGRGLEKVGNIAGDIFAPATMSLIPGTDLNKQTQIHQIQGRLPGIREKEAETAERAAQTANIESETRARDTADKENLINDAQGNVVGWKDNKGALHSLDEEGTPQGIKDIAATTANKVQPKFEKDENGNIVALKTDKSGKTSSEVVYKGDPKLETDLVHGHLVEGKPHTIIVNKKNGAMVKDLGEEAKGEAAAGEHDIELVRGTDKNGKVHLLSKAEATAGGYTHISKASDADVKEAKTHTVILNDLQAKLNDVVASRKALDQDAAQRAIIARSLRSIDKYKTIGQLADAGILSGATPETNEYIQSVLSLRESGLGMPKELTGGARVSEIQASALWQTIPGGASLNGNYALNQAKKFQANIDRLRERPEIVEGLSTVEKHPELQEQKKGGAGEAPGIVRDANGNVDWKKTLGIEAPAAKKP